MTVHAAILDVIDLDDLHFLLSLGSRRQPRHLFSQSMAIGYMSWIWSIPPSAPLNLQNRIPLDMLFTEPLLALVLVVVFHLSFSILCPAGPWFNVAALLLFSSCFILLLPRAAGLPLWPFLF